MKGLFLASFAIVLITSGYCAPVLEKKSSPQVSDVTKKVTKDSPVVVPKEDVHKVSESSVKKSPEVPVVPKSDKITTDSGKDKVKPIPVVPVAPQYFAEDVMKNAEQPKVPMRPEEPKVAQSPSKKETNKPSELKSPMPMRSSEEKKDSEKKLDSLPTSTGDLSKKVESPKKKDEKVKSPIVKDEKRTEESSSKLDGGESKVKSPMVVRDEEEKKKMDQAEEMKKIKSPMVSNTEEMKKIENFKKDEMKTPLSTRSEASAEKNEAREKQKSPDLKDDKKKVMDDSVSKKLEAPKDEMKVKSPMAESEKKKMEMKPVEEMKKSPLDEMKKSPMDDMKKTSADEMKKSPMVESEKRKMEMKPVEEMKKSPMAESDDKKMETEAKKSPMLDAMRNKAPMSKDEEEKKKLDSSKVMMDEEMKKKSPMSDVMKKPMEDAMKMKDDLMKEMKVKDEMMKVKDEGMKKFENEKKFESWKPSESKIKSPEMDGEMKKKVDESKLMPQSNKKAESPIADSKKKLETPVMMKESDKKVAENIRPLDEMDNSKKSEEKRIKSPIVKEEEKRIENPKEPVKMHQSPVKTEDKKVVASDIVDSDKKIKETIKPYANVDPISKSPENWKTDKTSSSSSNIGVSGYAIDIKSEENGKDVLTYLSEPINQATKLLMDLDEHIKGYLNTSPDVPTTLSPAHSYGAQDPPSAPAVGAANPPTRQDGEQLAPMINQIENTLQSLDQTINDMMANRRYMSAAMMRSMRTYLRGVQTNLVRLQNRVRQIQAMTTAGQGQGESASPGGASSLGLPNNIFFDSLRDRINRITNDITNLMYRMSQTLGGSSTTPKPPTSP